MPAPGFFEIYPSARPPLPAGTYTVTTHQDLHAAPPNGAPGNVPVDDAQFRVHIDSPRYTLPPDQILSTFPPAGSQGDWRERLPQIVLKRRTLPWERNPDPAGPFETAPPWLALVVLADGEGQLSPNVDVSHCVTPGVDLGPDADVPQGKYLDVGVDVVERVFPCRDELHLLAHVRKVDLRDTELALGDDDGFLAVVLSSRLPQPGPPAAPGGIPTPMKYTAYLLNLEHQLGELLPTEPTPLPMFSFDATAVAELVDPLVLAPAPDSPLDKVAMGLHDADDFHGVGAGAPGESGAAGEAGGASSGSAAVAYPISRGSEPAAAGWATGPTVKAAATADDLSVAGAWKSGAVSLGGLGLRPLVRHVRFPVLVSWEFTCTGEGGFERLMNKLKVGLLGTLAPDQPAPVPEVAPTGHVSLSHRSRRGEPARSWYRGPLVPQPTARTVAAGGVLPLAHTGDQLRKVVPDGREDISLAAAFEIARLLTFSKPGIVAALMAWRRELFGAARARSIADLAASSVFADLGLGVAGGRTSLEDLVRHHVVMSLADAPPDHLAPRASDVGAVRVPSELAGIDADQVLLGLGADPVEVRGATAGAGAAGLGAVVVPVTPASATPVSRDAGALAMLQSRLSQRVEQLAFDAMSHDLGPSRASEVAGDVAGGVAGAVSDTLDELIAAAEQEDA